MSALVITKKVRQTIVGATLAMLAVGVLSVEVFTDASRTPEPSGLASSEFGLFEGGDATFADFEGKPLVINFWASWCPACVAELPEIQSVHEQYGDKVTIIGVANADDRSAALQLADEVGLTYMLGEDPTGDLFRSLELIAMPTTLFISADGEVREVFGGQLNEKALSERIATLFDQS
jgi:cytochrome c biogenesis protein CcmG/thiol:disulfide interchange protein DsbE